MCFLFVLIIVILNECFVVVQEVLKAVITNKYVDVLLRVNTVYSIKNRDFIIIKNKVM